MRKDARLSFRIPQSLRDRINKAIENSDGKIRDRSEFGSKAVQFYLDYIENTSSETQIILNSIIALAENVGVESEEIDHIKHTINDRNHYPKRLVSNKQITDHPKFEELMNIREKLDNDNKKELYQKLSIALYDELDDLYSKYKKKIPV